MREDGRAERTCAALFEDQDFPCEDASLFCDSSTPMARLQGDITWRRPQEICQRPALFPTNINAAHPKQGLLGDCWFLCACTVLLKRQHLLNKVLPPGQPQWGDARYKGSFRFCFWQRGQWTDVTIDDRLPCINSTLCFSCCHAPGAFWVALLEKAYAKLHGSYEQLWAGQVSEALVELTGTVAEQWSLGSADGSDEEPRSDQDSDQKRRKRFNLRLLKSVQDDCFLTCSTHNTSEGVGELGQYHAMTVMEWLDVERLSESQVQLFRIRNPWGRCCWGGAWMLSGPGWSSVDPVCASDLQARVSEGEFWLDEAEFVSQFDDITVGYPINKEGHLKSIYTGNILTLNHQQVGRWVKGVSAGGCRNSSSYISNPKYWLKVCTRGEILVSLLQHPNTRNAEKYARTPLSDRKSTKYQNYQAIALHMWKVEKKHLNLSRLLNKPPCVSTHCHAHDREVVLRDLLEPGYYLLIPSTYQPGAEAHFLMRVFSSSSTSFTSLFLFSALKTPAPSLPLLTDTEWETTYFQGSWVTGSTAGGSRNFLSHRQNPCFPFTVRAEPTVKPGVNVRITLHQSRPDTDLLPIGFHVYKVPEGGCEQMLKEEDPVASCLPHCYTQAISLDCSLPPGYYTLVPSTYEPDCSADFTLSLAHRVHRLAFNFQSSLNYIVSHISVMQS
uniref:Calpain 10 n=1 Tax=Oryzias sinensis TaxID=183150 RepID=A0A8C8DDL4_9TELE